MVGKASTCESDVKIAGDKTLGARTDGGSERPLEHGHSLPTALE
jgi:hypothetical protein